MVFPLVYVVEEVGIDHVDINALEGDEEVGRVPAYRLDRENRRIFPLNIFEDGKRLHRREGVVIVANGDAGLYQAEVVKRGKLGRVERYRGRCDDDKQSEEIVTEEHRGDSTRDRDDAERPIPIGGLWVMLVFSPIPLGNGCARHMRSIHHPRRAMRSD